jgi:hypothetical protein
VAYRKESLVPGNERMFLINGAASCVEVQGGVDGPTVLVGSSMLSWPNELWKRRDGHRSAGCRRRQLLSVGVPDATQWSKTLVTRTAGGRPAWLTAFIGVI